MNVKVTSEERSKSRAPRKIRVLHIVPSEYGHRFDGQTHWLFSLLSGWRDEDIALDLWGSSVRPLNIGSGNLDYELAAQLWPPGRREPGARVRLMDAARQLAYLATHAHSFDIAHFHKLGWGTLLSPLLLHLLGKKAVFTMSLYGSDNPSAVMVSRGGSWSFRLMHHFDGTVALSPMLAKDSLESGLRSVICLPNFLAVPRLERGRDAATGEKLRRELSIPFDATVLLFVGGVIRRKGVDLLAESFARLALRHDDVWLVVVGQQSRAESPGIDEEFVRALRERIDRAGVTSRVVWVGLVRDKNALARYYSAADVFVFPTRAEGLANVLIEASAAGLPVVATYLQGITDVPVEDGETGLLFPPEDTDALTQAVEQLITDSTLRAKMGQAARAHSKQFGFENYRRQLKAFYLKMAGLSP